MIKTDEEIADFMDDLARPYHPYKTRHGVYQYDPKTGKYGYRGNQDVATSWYSKLEFAKVIKEVK